MLLVAPDQHRVRVLLHGVYGVFIDHAPAAFPTVKRGGFGGVDRCGPIHCGASVFGRGHIPHDDGGLRVVLVGPEHTGRGRKARVDALLGQALAIGFFEPAGVDVGAIAPVIDLRGLRDVNLRGFRGSRSYCAGWRGGGCR